MGHVKLTLPVTGAKNATGPAGIRFQDRVAIVDTDLVPGIQAYAKRKGIECVAYKPKKGDLISGGDGVEVTSFDGGDPVDPDQTVNVVSLPADLLDKDGLLDVEAAEKLTIPQLREHAGSVGAEMASSGLSKADVIQVLKTHQEQSDLARQSETAEARKAEAAAAKGK